MAERSVAISIVVKVEGSKQITAEFEVEGAGCDEALQRELKRLGREVVSDVLVVLDDRLSQEVPGDWQNVGKEEREVIMAVGPVRLRRRVYRDAGGQRHKPLDEVLRLKKYERLSHAVKAKGAYLASEVSYRQAAGMLSWMLDEDINHSRIQRIVWDVGAALAEAERQQQAAVFKWGAAIDGGQVAAQTLYGESDGVYIHLQQERMRRAEVRVGIMYTGKRAIGVGRRALENKVCLTALVQDSQEWQEMLLKSAYAHYDLEKTTQLVVGGDGNTWVRHSFDRFEIEQVFQLDRFHLYRAARQAMGYNRDTGQLVHRCCTQGLVAVEDALRQLMTQAVGARRQRIVKLAKYLYQNADVLIDYDRRLPASFGSRCGLGAIEGNVDKLVVHRMKGRGRSWRLPGARAMLALCRHKADLQRQAFHLPELPSNTGAARLARPYHSQDTDWLQRSVPILHSCAEGRPWVQTLKQHINGSSDLSFL